ncbi:hypothetical protein; putative exported protein [Cupriavidus taiwanensis LMG 19424]|uniref:Uncharacterized protein n=1 Tax=Cupriavidus taiwanensis (strain DSM 17343 / BCRC 17206 / CCUG 44338 / CIP 107171 / LMG 19424 / R1) TaxID=977880 RepID=B3R9J5_CUPTR|nr:hypothetical protein; putative exported protein [Cupriavidus taiwanensis LMG 19424]
MILNLAILLLIAVGLLLTQNPLMLLGLLLLRDLPYQLAAMQLQAEDEPSNPIGFTT